MKKVAWSGLGIATAGILAFALSSPKRADAHCQVPCGIYDDPARIQALFEDQETIAKAIKQIQELNAKTDAQSHNQTTRWILTKEWHASHIITVVSEYFLTQKVKDIPPGGPGYDAYLKTLATHHRVLRAAMQTKQTVDPAAAKALHDTIHTLGELYPAKK